MNSSQTGSCSSYTKYNPSTPPRNVPLIPTQHLSSQHHSALNTAKWNTCKESQYFVFAWEKVNLWAMDIKKRKNRCLLKLEDIWKIWFHSSQLCSVQWIPELSFHPPLCISAMLTLTTSNASIMVSCQHSWEILQQDFLHQDLKCKICKNNNNDKKKPNPWNCISPSKGNKNPF